MLCAQRVINAHADGQNKPHACTPNDGELVCTFTKYQRARAHIETGAHSRTHLITLFGVVHAARRLINHQTNMRFMQRVRLTRRACTGLHTLYSIHEALMLRRLHNIADQCIVVHSRLQRVCTYVKCVKTIAWFINSIG